MYSEDHYNGVLKNYKNTQMVTFFDLDENGIMDLFLIWFNDTIKKNQIITLVNTYHWEYFLKIKIINLSQTKQTLYTGSIVRAVITELNDD